MFRILLRSHRHSNRINIDLNSVHLSGRGFKHRWIMTRMFSPPSGCFKQSGPLSSEHCYVYLEIYLRNILITSIKKVKAINHLKPLIIRFIPDTIINVTSNVTVYRAVYINEPAILRQTLEGTSY